MAYHVVGRDELTGREGTVAAVQFSHHVRDGEQRDASCIVILHQYIDIALRRFLSEVVSINEDVDDGAVLLFIGCLTLSDIPRRW